MSEKRSPSPATAPATTQAQVEARVDHLMEKLKHLEGLVDTITMQVRIAMLEAIVEDQAQTIEAMQERLEYLEQALEGEPDDSPESYHDGIAGPATHP